MMELKNKVAVVTGASSGIGAAIVTELLESGMKVVGIARRVEMVENLGKNHKESLFAVKADLTKQEDIHEAFRWIETNIGPIHAFINNAGIVRNHAIDKADPVDIAAILNTNLLATTLFTQKAIKSMNANKIEGTIINICSVAGHTIINAPGISVYTASKFGSRAFTESIRGELAKSGSKIRITNLSPGVVESEITAKVQGLLDTAPYLLSKDIADAVKYILTLPQNVNIAELTIRPTGERF